jgi:hypothetical protein
MTDLKKLVLDQEKNPKYIGAYSAFTLKWIGKSHLEAWTYSVKLRSHFVLLAQGFDNQRLYAFDDAYNLWDEDSMKLSLYTEVFRIAQHRINLLRKIHGWEVELENKTEFLSERPN